MDITFALALFAAINAAFIDIAVVIGIVCWFCYSMAKKQLEEDEDIYEQKE